MKITLRTKELRKMKQINVLYFHKFCKVSILNIEKIDYFIIWLCHIKDNEYFKHVLMFKVYDKLHHNNTSILK